jgi:dTDP-4-amino-4,6-dideoxygalactose transaminase
VEVAITERTTAILPVHCYGVPCDVEAIEAIADQYSLKVIYDAAHAFGVNCHCGSVLNHGDLSVMSFHATKVFNTFEGGAIVCRDEKMKLSIDRLKNFGFAGETKVVATGINGKMNELQAAVGLLQLQSMDAAIEMRAAIAARYRSELETIEGLCCPPDSSALRDNHAYFPILVEPPYPLSRDELYEKLKQAGIYGRRYFYPLITEFPMYRQLPSGAGDQLPVARRIASQVICLPIYPALSAVDLDRILDLLHP